MNCELLQGWLNDGMPEHAGTVAAAHAASCARCAAALAAAREIDSWLETAAVAAPDDLTRRVLARIEAVEALRDASSGAAALAPETLGAPMVWWVRAAGDPAAALAFTVAGLVIWKGEVITAVAMALAAQATGWVAAAIERAAPAAHLLASRSGSLAHLPVAETLSRPDVMLGVAFPLAPALAWVSWRLWRWAEDRV